MTTYRAHGQVDPALLTHVPSGDYVYRKGDTGEEMFIINEGQIEILKSGGGADERLVLLGKGDLFGELAVLEDLPRSTSARAVCESTLIRVDRNTFDRMLRSKPEIAVRIMRKLARRLHAAEGILDGQSVPAEAQPGERGRESQARHPRCQLRHSVSSTFFSLDLSRIVTVGRRDPVTGLNPQVDLSTIDPDRSSSRQHAKLFYQNERFYLTEDIGTTNGTFVNNSRVQAGQPVELQSGDRVRFGLVALSFEVG